MAVPKSKTGTRARRDLPASPQKSQATEAREASEIRLGEKDLERIASKVAEAITEAGTAALPQRRRTTLELASDVLEQPGLWLRTSNPQLGDRAPIELIGTGEEFKVYNLLNAVDQGLF